MPDLKTPLGTIDIQQEIIGVGRGICKVCGRKKDVLCNNKPHLYQRRNSPDQRKMCFACIEKTG